MRTSVQAVNALTSRWAGAVDVSHGTAFSAAGVWPLPAFLADGADGAPARSCRRPWHGSCSPGSRTSPGWTARSGSSPPTGTRECARAADAVGGAVPGDVPGLAVASTPFGYVTEVRVLGTASLGVHLLPGEPELPPSQVLLAGERPVVPGSQLALGDAGPGVRVRERPSTEPNPAGLDVLTAPFASTARHDLLSSSELFGLKTAQGRSHGHSPGVSGRPLAVSSAEQSAVARFGAEGFEAGN
ncbi:hypothetical protein [Streptomyces acidiscabies]|uniref:hypothetical protein n=1 Tax=Streptomyces acidiscabies TaxID=42234 RepID=UPI0038F80536